jgi:predicted RNA-binding protein Jag
MKMNNKYLEELFKRLVVAVEKIAETSLKTLKIQEQSLETDKKILEFEQKNSNVLEGLVDDMDIPKKIDINQEDIDKATPIIDDLDNNKDIML